MPIYQLPNTTQQTPNKIKFQGKIPDEKNTFFYAVSKDNDRQTGYNFSLYVNWVIENKNKVGSLDIILSDFLNRFYVGNEKASNWGENWKEENKDYLEKLTEEKINYKVVHWTTVIENDEYSKCKKNVDELFEHNAEFKTVVNGLARSHQNKGGLNEAVNYLLEESAGIASLKTGILTYPAQRLNGAIHCALENLKCGPTYIGHWFVHAKSSFDPQYNLHRATFAFMSALQQSGCTKREDQLEYIKRAMQCYASQKKIKDFSVFSAELKKTDLNAIDSTTNTTSHQL